MKRTSLATTIGAVLSAIALTAGPASAQNHGREGSRGSQHEQSSRGSERAAPRVAPRAAPPAAVEGRAVERAVPRVAPRYDARDYRAVRPPIVVAPRVVRPYVARPYVVRPYYVRPYAFRPRFSIGFGFYAGYPIPYTYAYPYPVPVYGYGAPPAPVYVGPNATAYGGVSLEITPGDASVYVDGSYAGVVQDFDGTRGTLTLATGRHHVEISAPGYEPMAFDVDTVPGQIVPYRGDLLPVRY